MVVNMVVNMVENCQSKMTWMMQGNLSTCGLPYGELTVFLLLMQHITDTTHTHTPHRDLQSRDIDPSPPPATTAPPPQHPPTTTTPPPSKAAPSTRPRTAKLLKRAHTQVDPMLRSTQQQQAHATKHVTLSADIPAHKSNAPPSSLQHAESDAAGINAAWLSAAAQHPQQDGKSRGRSAPHGSHHRMKPPMQLTFPAQPPCSYQKVGGRVVCVLHVCCVVGGRVVCVLHVCSVGASINTCKSYVVM